MNKTLFTSDTHWSHENIIKYSKRPFKNVQEMDEALIERWNAVVGVNDTLYHLGDFKMGRTSLDSILCRLNGNLHFIWGNHDRDDVKKHQRWLTSGPYAEINLGKDFIVMSHYAHRVWNRSHRGAIQLYGHSHGSLPGNSQSCDVGVDCWDYRPVTLDEIKDRLRTLPTFRAVDHHGRD